MPGSAVRVAAVLAAVVVLLMPCRAQGSQASPIAHDILKAVNEFYAGQFDTSCTVGISLDVSP